MNGYKIEKFINKGSYGKIHVATKNNTQYAVKMSNVSQFHDKLVLLQELKILAGNRSKYLLHLIDIFCVKSIVYVIVPLGMCDLSIYLRKNILSLEKCLELFGQIISGVRHLHENYIIHRDIKPENIIVLDENTVKLADFGTCKSLRGTNLTRTMIGTPYYMSPDVFRNVYYDYSVDIWGLGCVFYYMNFRKVPFDARNLDELKFKVCNSNVQIPTKNEIIVSLVKLMLQKRKYSRINIKTLCEHQYVKKYIDYVYSDMKQLQIHQHHSPAQMVYHTKNCMLESIAKVTPKKLSSLPKICSPKHSKLPAIIPKQNTERHKLPELAKNVPKIEARKATLVKLPEIMREPKVNSIEVSPVSKLSKLPKLDNIPQIPKVRLSPYRNQIANQHNFINVQSKPRLLPNIPTKIKVYNYNNYNHFGNFVKNNNMNFVNMLRRY